MSLAMLAVALPVVGFLLTFAISRLFSPARPGRWSLKLAALASATVPIGVAMAFLNLTFESGMLGAVGAFAGVLLSAGAWLGHFLVWLGERKISETKGTGFSKET